METSAIEVIQRSRASWIDGRGVGEVRGLECE